MTIRPSHGSPTAGTDDGKGLFETVAPQHDGVGVVCGSGADAVNSYEQTVGHGLPDIPPEASVIFNVASRLKAFSVPTIRPRSGEAHATCCKGWRKAQTHSPYCFSQREFYVAYVHPSALAMVNAIRKAGAENSGL